MPGHHPVPSRVSGQSLLNLRREREQLVEDVCCRLSADLDHDVVALKSLVRERGPDFWLQAACPTPARRRSESERGRR